MKYNLKKDIDDKRDYKFAKLIAPLREVKIPRKVDLRPKMPAVYDQGDLGSCTAQAGCGYMAYMNGKPIKMFSRLYMYYKVRFMENNVNEDTGGTMRSVPKAINKYGVCLEQFMPYVEADFKKAPPPSAEQNAQNYKINSYHSIKSIAEIKQCLALRQMPVLLGMDVYESFESDYTKKSGRMKMPKPDEQYLGGHAVLVVGYEDKAFGGGHLIVRNSWGEKWGDRGYFYMPYTYVDLGHTFDYWTLD